MGTQKLATPRRKRPLPATSARHPSSTVSPSPRREVLDAGCIFAGTSPLHDSVRRRVIGQDNAIDKLVCAYSRLLSGLRDPSRPLLTGLLLGPTGVGKTETAKALAHTLFGSERAMTRINCEEYAHGHELSKLLGSPPGYVGHAIEPLLSQRRIDDPHRRLREQQAGDAPSEPPLIERILNKDTETFQTIVLFDEIEKAHPSVWNALLGILEDGMLTLGDNSTTDFTHSIILMTSNVGSREMGELLERNPIGFRPGDEDTLQQAPATVHDTALMAARNAFPLEFLNRFDEVLVYSALERRHLEAIFEKFLADIHQRAITEAGVPILIRISPDAKQLIVDRGTDHRFGARPLRRAMERELVDPLSRLIASEQLSTGDVVEVEREDGHLMFYRVPRTVEVANESAEHGDTGNSHR